MNEKREKLIASLKEKAKRQQELIRELEGSIRIRDLWPEAFNTGGCKEMIYGGPASGYRFRITQNGEEKMCREWPLSEVPHEVIRNYLGRTNIDLKQDRELARALKKIGFMTQREFIQLQTL